MRVRAFPFLLQFFVRGLPTSSNALCEINARECVYNASIPCQHSTTNLFQQLKTSVVLANDSFSTLRFTVRRCQRFSSSLFQNSTKNYFFFIYSLFVIELYFIAAGCLNLFTVKIACHAGDCLPHGVHTFSFYYYETICTFFN